MTNLTATAPPTAMPSPALLRLAGWCAYVSGVVSVIGLIFLFAFFGGLGGYFGTLNDTAVVIQYVLMLPLAFTLHRIVRPYGPALNRVAMLVGYVGMLAVIVLQTLLVVDVLPFQQQIVMVVPAFLVVVVWFVLVTHLGRDTGILPRSIPLSVLAGLVFGYVFWAFKLGRRLLSM